MPFDAIFNANEIPPQQGGGKHPVGNKFPFEVTGTLVKSTKDGKGGMFEVELTSPAGTIRNNYNLWNENDTARKIAQQQLSALCHATGRFQLDFKNDGAALCGGRGLMDIGFQAGQEPSAEKPEGGYVELKKVYDVNGNEPGKAGVQQQQPQHQPNTQQPQQGGGANWNNAGATQQQPQVQSGWGGGAPQTGPQNDQQPPNGGGGWQQGGGQTTPPWKQ